MIDEAGKNDLTWRRQYTGELRNHWFYVTMANGISERNIPDSKG